MSDSSVKDVLTAIAILAIVIIASAVAITILTPMYGTKDTEDVVGPEEYSVYFDGNGGTPAERIIVAKNNAKIAEPTQPYRAGYLFNGWFKESACIHKWDFNTDKVRGVTTLYAKWI